MAISFVNSAQTGFSAAATSIAGTIPAGVVDGDFLLWTIAGRAGSIASWGVLAGWTLWRANVTVGTTVCVSYWYRIAQSEPASYTQSGLTSGSYCTHTLAFRGVDQQNPADVTPLSATNASGLATTSGFLAPTTPGAWVVLQRHGNKSAASATATWANGNMTALVGQTQATVASVANPAIQAGYFSTWTSGAYTPSITSSAGTFNAGADLTSLLRPARPRPVIVVSQAVMRSALW